METNISSHSNKSLQPMHFWTFDKCVQEVSFDALTMEMKIQCFDLENNKSMVSYEPVSTLVRFTFNGLDRIIVSMAMENDMYVCSRTFSEMFEGNVPSNLKSNPITWLRHMAMKESLFSVCLQRSVIVSEKITKITNCLLIEDFDEVYKKVNRKICFNLERFEDSVNKSLNILDNDKDNNVKFIRAGHNMMSKLSNDALTIKCEFNSNPQVSHFCGGRTCTYCLNKFYVDQSILLKAKVAEIAYVETMKDFTQSKEEIETMDSQNDLTTSKYYDALDSNLPKLINNTLVAQIILSDDRKSTRQPFSDYEISALFNEKVTVEDINRNATDKEKYKEIDCDLKQTIATDEIKTNYHTNKVNFLNYFLENSSIIDTYLKAKFMYQLAALDNNLNLIKIFDSTTESISIERFLKKLNNRCSTFSRREKEVQSETHLVDMINEETTLLVLMEVENENVLGFLQCNKLPKISETKPAKTNFTSEIQKSILKSTPKCSKMFTHLFDFQKNRIYLSKQVMLSIFEKGKPKTASQVELAKKIWSFGDEIKTSEDTVSNQFVYLSRSCSTTDSSYFNLTNLLEFGIKDIGMEVEDLSHDDDGYIPSLMNPTRLSNYFIEKESSIRQLCTVEDEVVDMSSKESDKKGKPPKRRNKNKVKYDYVVEDETAPVITQKKQSFTVKKLEVYCYMEKYVEKGSSINNISSKNK